MKYYDADGNKHEDVKGRGGVWCHITGEWCADEVVAAHIVPPFLDTDEIGEILLGSRAPSLTRAGDCRFLRKRTGKWFDSHHIVIVPVDPEETPIKRWKVEVISTSIENEFVGGGGSVGQNLDGMELKFRNDKRPVLRFMYFHFIMALVRIKDVQRSGWKAVWARYYQEAPFPTPGPYLRKSMLLALATHFGTITTNMKVIDSCIKENGFDSPLILTDVETREAARRVHIVVENAVVCAEKDPYKDSESNSGDSSNEEESERGK